MIVVDRLKLREILLQDCGGASLCSELLQQRPHLFPAGVVLLDRELARRMEETVAAAEAVAALPAYREAVFARGPEAHRFDPGAPDLSPRGAEL